MFNRVLSLNNLNESFNVRGDVVSLEVTIPGVIDPFEVTVHLTIKELYAAVESVEITKAPVKIGEVRREALNKQISIIFNDPSLYLDSYEIEEGFVFGTHDLNLKSGYSSHRGVLHLLEKINAESLEQLMIQKEKKRGKEEIAIYYFLKAHVLILNSEEDTKATFTSEGIEGLFKHVYGNMAIDQHGNLYTKYKLEDPNNIRLLPAGIDSLNRGYTYKEYQLEKEKTIQSGLPLHVEISTSYHSHEFTIFSERVLGSDVPEFQYGDWIVNNEGLYGKVIKQDRTTLRILFENMYTIESHVRYSEVVRVDDPRIIYNSPRIVRFSYNEEGYYEFYGYGWLISEVGNTSKVIPIGDQSTTRHTRSLINNRLGIHFRESVDEAYSRHKEYHGEAIDFLLLEMKQVEECSAAEEKAVKLLYIDNKEYKMQNIITNIFKLAKIPSQNYAGMNVMSLLIQQNIYALDYLSKLTEKLTENAGPSSTWEWMKILLRTTKQ